MGETRREKRLHTLLALSQRYSVREGGREGGEEGGRERGEGGREKKGVFILFQSYWLTALASKLITVV